MFNKHVHIPTMTPQDIKEYTDEREGIRIYCGEQSEESAVQGAKEDLRKVNGS